MAPAGVGTTTAASLDSLGEALKQLGFEFDDVKAAGTPADSSTESSPSLPDYSELSARVARMIEHENWSAALQPVVEEYDMTCRAYGECDERSLQVLGTYAGVLWQLNRNEDARELLEELVAKRSAVVASLSCTHLTSVKLASARDLLTDALIELSTVLLETEHAMDAVPLLEQALDIRTSLHGPASEDALQARDQLSRAFNEAGMASQAIDCLRTALSVKQDVHGLGSQEVADCHNELAVVLQSSGDVAAAVTEAQLALGLYAALFGDSHLHTATCISNLATLMMQQPDT